MGIINQVFLKNVVDRLKNNDSFSNYARALSSTISFKDDDGEAYITFYCGKPIAIEQGVSETGSDFYISASNDNWDTMMREPRFGIFEENGFARLTLRGNIYIYCGNAMAFYILWNTMKDVYLDNGGH